jgi:hypothetical protein
MNLSRTDFNFPQYHEINITPNWLLGGVPL